MEKTFDPVSFNTGTLLKISVIGTRLKAKKKIEEGCGSHGMPASLRMIGGMHPLA